MLLVFAAAAAAAADGVAVGGPLTAVEGLVSGAVVAGVAAAGDEAGREACWEGGSQFLVKTHSAGDGGQHCGNRSHWAETMNGTGFSPGEGGLLCRSKM